MKKLTIAVCEIQDAYRERLAEYFMRKKGAQAELFTFSGRRSYLQECKTRQFDIVLWGEGFEGISRENGSLNVCLSQSSSWSKELEPAIFKYQSVEEIWRQLFCHYLKIGREDASISRQEKEVLGIYSPSRSRLQMPFALTLAQILSEEQKTLYVNLGEWTGFGLWLQQDYHRDLADLLYLLSGQGPLLQGALESVLYSLNRLDYIPPMVDAQLVCETTAADYQKLLELLIHRTEYQTIVLDFGIMVPGFLALLDQCTSIYALGDPGTLARSQWQQFQDSIMKSGISQLAEKINYLCFSPQEDQLLEREPVLQQWVCGELGDRARAARYAGLGGA